MPRRLATIRRGVENRAFAGVHRPGAFRDARGSTAPALHPGMHGGVSAAQVQQRGSFLAQGLNSLRNMTRRVLYRCKGMAAKIPRAASTGQVRQPRAVPLHQPTGVPVPSRCRSASQALPARGAAASRGSAKPVADLNCQPRAKQDDHPARRPHEPHRSRSVVCQEGGDRRHRQLDFWVKRRPRFCLSGQKIRAAHEHESKRPNAKRPEQQHEQAECPNDPRHHTISLSDERDEQESGAPPRNGALNYVFRRMASRLHGGVKRYSSRPRSPVFTASQHPVRLPQTFPLPVTRGERATHQGGSCRASGGRRTGAPSHRLWRAPAQHQDATHPAVDHAVIRASDARAECPARRLQPRRRSPFLTR